MAEEQPVELTIEIAGKTYPFPSFDTLTYKEARLIKKVTGVVMGQFFEALEGGDPDSLVAIALVAMGREGVPFDPDDLDDLLITDIRIIVPEPVVEADPASPLDGSKPESDDSTGDEPLLSVAELSAS